MFAHMAQQPHFQQQLFPQNPFRNSPDPFSPSNHTPTTPRAAHDINPFASHDTQRIPRPSLYDGYYPGDSEEKLAVQISQAQKSTSEHLLRRKTPNGTLAAGYDATPTGGFLVDSSTTQPLLPIAQNGGIPEVYTDVSPLSDLSRAIRRSAPLLNQNNLMMNTGMGSQNLLGAGSGYLGHTSVANWKAGSKPRLGYDSVLDQGPIPVPQLYFLPDGTPVPIALQPYPPSFIGPTASNEPGNYGPYWPDGSFVPYRPAAYQDPRFARQGTDLVGAKPTPPLTGNNGNSGFSQFLSPGARGDSGALEGPIYGLLQNTANSFHGPVPINMLARPPTTLGPSALQQNSNQLASHRQRSAQSLSNRTNASITGRSFDVHNANAQSKEDVLSWTHAVYVDLLASIHHQQKVVNQDRSRQPASKHTIFPRPPKQPEAKFPSKDENLQIAANIPQRLGQDHRGPPGAKRLKVCSDGPKPRVLSVPVDSASSPNGKPTFHDLSFRRRALQYQLQQQYQLRRVNLTDSTIQESGTPSNPIVTQNRSQLSYLPSAASKAKNALEILTKLCRETEWTWIDGLLLGGCLAYGLGDHQTALWWYCKILEIDSEHVEAMSNAAATLLSLNRKAEAEEYWMTAIRLRPSYFEAVEHVVGLLCNDNRGREALNIIESIQRSLRITLPGDSFKSADNYSETASEASHSSTMSNIEVHDPAAFDYDSDDMTWLKDTANGSDIGQAGFGSSGYAIPGKDNGRMLTLVHAKGNMLYSLGDAEGAARAFEDAVLIGSGTGFGNIQQLIIQVLLAVSRCDQDPVVSCQIDHIGHEPLLLPPDRALQTSRLVFPNDGELPGLKYVSRGIAKNAAVSIMSNSLLSLAKIYQDGMSSAGFSSNGSKSTSGVRDILALYYLSLSLQPSPSTANNVGILLAGIQQTAPNRVARLSRSHMPSIPGVVPGSGVALALAYYNYGLNLDNKHAHLYTNLGSLLKDIGQLTAAIQMYERAVACDGNFDIALANLANAVKDQGKIGDAIGYYRRAVASSPDFAEAVCGLANALNSVCAWAGRGGLVHDQGRRDRFHVNDQGMLLDSRVPGSVSTGWIKRVVDIVEKQLSNSETWGRAVIQGNYLQTLLEHIRYAEGLDNWDQKKLNYFASALKSWAGAKWEGFRVVRLIERTMRRLGWRRYQDKYIRGRNLASFAYSRPPLPANLPVPNAPTVLPFHTFTYPLTAKQIRMISQRNGLQISYSTLKSPWLPSSVFPPPAPPSSYLKVGYVSSDFNNHPLAHLMQSVFGFHDSRRVKAFCYATTASDNSSHRLQIEREAPVFHDASLWSAERLVKQIVSDGIHILVNLNGYTRGARNEVFAARPAPIQMAFMGFAGTLGAEWCDYLLADDTAIPPSTLRQWRRNIDLVDVVVDGNTDEDNDDWVYGENIIFARDTFFCCDHRQSAPDSQDRRLSWSEEQSHRWEMRKELFPDLSDDTIILGNFNQLYKIEPTTFRTWIRILSRVPNAILWLLRFPDLGETHLKNTALLWAGAEVASRIYFTDVAAKQIHISRARICDLFLDTPECNAHTTAADILWSATPLLTLPGYPYKMCSRMAASILKGALPKGPEGELAARDLIANSDEEYEELAVSLGSSLTYSLDEPGRATGRLMELRKILFESRWDSALFDTRRWVRDLEEAYGIAWSKWVRDEGGDIWL